MNSMTRAEMAKVMEAIFEECGSLRDAGQKEYAHDADNAFANFERLGASLDLSREKILMVYLLKHIDGIVAWTNGHRSQREGVRGRIKDCIVYLCLLAGMDECERTACVPERRFGPGATGNAPLYDPKDVAFASEHFRCPECGGQRRDGEAICDDCWDKAWNPDREPGTPEPGVQAEKEPDREQLDAEYAAMQELTRRGSRAGLERVSEKPRSIPYGQYFPEWLFAGPEYDRDAAYEWLRHEASYDEITEWLNEGNRRARQREREERARQYIKNHPHRQQESDAYLRSVGAEDVATRKEPTENER